MDSKQLTNNRFGKWGWSMIIYTLLLYYIYAGLCRQHEPLPGCVCGYVWNGPKPASGFGHKAQRSEYDQI